MPKPLAPRNPLAPGVFLLRNAGKTLPLVLVIMLAVMLIAGIVSMMNSIPYSIRTIYDYSKRYTGITPRGDPSQTPILRQAVLDESPVKLGRVITCRASEAVVRSIVGKWPFVVVALGQDDMRYYLDQMEVERVEGRLPAPGAAEAIISEPVARNLNLKLGDPLLGPEINDAYSPQEVKIVGIARTDRWLKLTPIEYHQANHFPPIDLLIAFAEDPREQAKLDRWAIERFKGERARVFAYELLDRDTEEMFQILYKILNVVIGTLVVVITFMMGMLMNIYQSQRVQEFGLLQALGYTRRALLKRVLMESVLVVVGGWVLGVGCALLLLNAVKSLLMDPQAFALNPLDPAAYLYSIPAPIAILAAAWYTVWLRFRRFDPVGVVERRLV